jgi:hypothetical protein
MYLNDGSRKRTNAIEQGYAGVSVGSSIEYYAVIGEPRLLHLIYHLTLDVALEIVYLHIRIALTQLWQVVVEGCLPVDARLAAA